MKLLDSRDGIRRAVLCHAVRREALQHCRQLLSCMQKCSVRTAEYRQRSSVTCACIEVSINDGFALRVQ